MLLEGQQLFETKPAQQARRDVAGNLPSYKTMMNREGVDGPGGLAIVGTEAEVSDQIAELASIGVTDFNAGVFAANPDEVARTNSVLRELA